MLDGFDLGEGDVWIADDEDFAGFPVLVDSEDAVGGGLGVGFLEELLAFEHDGENVAGVFGMRLVFLHESGEEFFGRLAGDDGFGVIGGGWFVFRAPVGEGLGGVVRELFPCLVRVVLADVAGGLGVRVDGGVEDIAFLEGLVGHGAAVAA